ncbi:hypothetical protein AX16_001054 [Volvariella volvacea WC 439]|nr:hypothetical protein AX16_001054 [Volvariella volvacea WC 439]
MLNGAGGAADGVEDPRLQIDTRQSPIEIYGPYGTRSFVRNSINHTHTMLSRPYVVHELRWPTDPHDMYEPPAPAAETPTGRNIVQVDGIWPGIYQDNIVSVSAAPIHHSVPCLGYVVQESPIPGKIDIQKYKADLDRTQTPLSVLRRLQQGESVELSDGTILRGPPRRPGRKVVILGDTCDPSPIADLANSADLLIHEATNAHLPGVDPSTKSSDTYKIVEERAKSRGHSTPQMAGAFAKKIQAKRLVLNHFSSRYSGAGTEDALTVMNAIGGLAEKEFGQSVTCARDLMSISMNLQSM